MQTVKVGGGEGSVPPVGPAIEEVMIVCNKTMHVYTHVRTAHARGVLKNPVQGANPRETRMSAYMRLRPLRLFCT